MGKIKEGILGGFSGKVGAVIGASWKGIEYMRGLPHKSNKPRTDGQLAQQMVFTLHREFCGGAIEFVDDCFQNYEKHTPMNSAISYNMINATTGIYPDLRVDFPNFMYSKGDLLGTWQPQAVSVTPQTLDLSWQNGLFNPMCSADDIVIALVYDPVSREFATFPQAAKRSDGMVQLELPGNFIGHGVHTYLSFYSKSRNISSTNQYVGETIVV